MSLEAAFTAMADRFDADALALLAHLEELLRECEDTHRARQSAERGTYWAAGEVFCLVGSVLSRDNRQSLGNRGSRTFNEEEFVLTGFDPNTGEPILRRRRNPGPGRGRNRRREVLFERPNRGVTELGGLGLALCRAGEGLRREGRR